MPEFQPYLNEIVHHYNKWSDWYTPMDAEGQEREQRSATPLFDFGLMAQTIVLKDEPELGDRSQPKIERLPVTEGLQKYAIDHVLLVGRPGSGKSTALARLMLDLVKGVQIPVLVELRSYQSSILELIRSSFKRHDLSLTIAEIETLLDDRRLILLIDGVNELPSELARTDLSNFRRNHSKVPMIFTTRDLGLGGDLGIEKKLEMQPLTEKQMRSFIHAYLPGKADAMLGQLRDRLREFGTTPLLLWMLCSLFARTEVIPQNLGEVFRAFTRGYEQQVKHDVVLESDRRLWFDLLKQLAAVMMQGDKPTEFRVAIAPTEICAVFADYLKTENPLVPRQALDDLLRHHLIQRNGELVEFRHQLIQEYYAAEWLLERVGTLDDETLECDYLNYLKWTESLALMLALVDDEKLSVRVVDRALAVDLMLGARLAGEVQSDLQEKTVELVNILKITDNFKVHLLEKTRSDQSISALFKISGNAKKDIYFKCIDIIGKIHSTESVRVLIKILRNSNNEISLKIIRSLGKMKLKIAHTSLLELYQGLNSTCKTHAARILKNSRFITNLPVELINKNAVFPVDKKSNELKEILREHKSKLDFLCLDNLLSIVSEEDIPVLSNMLDSDDSSLRFYAAQSLVNIGGDLVKPDLLKAVRDDEWDVRLVAAESLSREGSDQGVLAICKSLEESSSDARLEAVRILGDVGGHGVTPFLIKAFLEEKETDVRLMIVESMEKIGGFLAILGLRQAVSDPDLDICNAAIQSLGRVGNDEEIPLLLNIIEKNIANYGELQNDVTLCHSAIEALGNIKSEATISELMKLAKSQEWIIRFFAVEALSIIDTTESIPILLNAMNDPFPNIQSKAASGLSRYKDNRIHEILPKVLQLLLSSNGSENTKAIKTIQGIQSNCKFYNYEIYQKAIDRKPPATARGTPEVLAGIEQTVKQIRSQQMTEKPTYQSKYQITGNPTIIEGDQFVDGDNVGTKNIYGESEIDETLKQQIAELQQIIAELETAHPDITTEPQASAIISNKFKDLQTKRSPQWENILKFKRLYNGGKKATLKLGEHFAQENPWGKAIVAFLEGISEDLK